MIVLQEHRTAKFASGWYFRCCYGCHGCCGALFGPYASQHDALRARDGKETMHGLMPGPHMVHPNGEAIY